MSMVEVAEAANVSVELFFHLNMLGNIELNVDTINECGTYHLVTAFPVHCSIMPHT